MAANAPHVFVFVGLAQMLVAQHDVVDVLRFKRQMVQTRIGAFNAQKGVVINKGFTAVNAVERSDHVFFVAGIHLVRANQAEHFAVPLDFFFGVGRHDHRMCSSLDLGRPWRQAHQLTSTAQFVVAGVDHGLAHGQGCDLLHATHHFHLVAMGVADAYPLAATGLVHVFNATGTRGFGKLLELVFVVDEKTQAHELGRAQVRDMDVVIRVGAAHVQRIFGALGAVHAKDGEKLFGLVQAGRLQTAKGQVGDFDIGHGSSSLCYAASPK